MFLFANGFIVSSATVWKTNAFVLEVVSWATFVVFPVVVFITEGDTGDGLPVVVLDSSVSTGVASDALR